MSVAHSLLGFRHVCMLSGGAGSYVAAKRVVAAHGTDGVVALFADTLIEDPTLYAALPVIEQTLGIPVIRLAEGRTPWQVFDDERFLGNSKHDPCSRILKRELLDKWGAANCDVNDTTFYVGIDWTEEHRYIRLRERTRPWRYEAPLCNRPLIGKTEIIAEMLADGIPEQRLYKDGFSHNNCGGFCIKQGHAGFLNLLVKHPDRYADHEGREQALRIEIGKNVSILTDRRGDGKKKPLTLKDFRIRVEQGGKVDLTDIGGCNCFGGDDEISDRTNV